MSERYNEKPQYTDKTAGAKGPVSETEPISTGPFSDAHSASRGSSFDEWGMYTGPTTPGHLGNSPMFPGTTSEHSYTPGELTMVSRPPSGVCAAYLYPDAPGGQTMGASDIAHVTSGSEGSPWTGPGGDQR